MNRSLFLPLAGLLLPFAGYASAGGYLGGRRALAEAVSAQFPGQTSGQGAMRAAEARSTAVDTDTDELTLHAGQPIRELMIIDAGVADKASLYQALRPGMQAVELRAEEDGLAQLRAALAGHQQLDAVHVFSHATAGRLALGNAQIDSAALQSDPATFAAINDAMRAGGDLLIYGCDVARGDDGHSLLDLIAGHTHVDVAASDDLSGNADQGGDWDLEIQRGEIDRSLVMGSPALADFSGVLAPEVYTSGSFCTVGCGAGSASYTSSDGHFLFTGNASGSAENVYAYDTFRSNDGMYFSFQTSIDGDTSGFFNFAADGVNVGSFQLTALVHSTYGGSCTGGSVVGYVVGGGTVSNTLSWSGTNNSATLSNFNGVQITHFRVNGSGCSASVYEGMGVRSFTVDSKQTPADSDGSLTASGTVSEPVAIPTTVDTVGESVNVFDFTLVDGGTSDGQSLDVSQIVLHVSGTASDAQHGQVTWRLSGPDASNVAGSYNGASDTLTFSGLTISVADGANETYTVNAYYNDNTNLVEGLTYILSVDGDTDLTVGGSGTQMGATSAVNNGTGSTVSVTATALAFTTQPAGSTSGSALGTQPVVTARDAFGNTDADFTETVTLTESSAGTLTGGSVAASSGVATFTGLTYTATADQESFSLTANDQDGVGSDLPIAVSNSVTSDVVATALAFSTQPAPTSITSGQATAFSTVPVVRAVDAQAVVDTGYSTNIVLSEANGAGSATLTGTGDVDGNAATVTLTPSSGVATFTGLSITYTNVGASETLNLRATSGGLTAADSTAITSSAGPVVTDANISISGASGTSGAYRIGDTVTATWNNTAGGDNNAGVTAVTVDFSQFGGGAAVTATNSSGTWTATYTLTAGAIDTTNRNVSVTASNAGASTTSADSSNATVDNVAPTVTDGNISISGASGTGGAFKIGDTVTATWNNTAGGDNNTDTIVGATVDFSQFGGGAAVVASNSAGTWTATYTVVAGAIDATNRNVSVTATDNAGNPTTTAGTSNATVDSAAPTVTDARISISGASGTGGAYKIGDTVTASWNNTAGGDNNSDTMAGVTVDFSQFGGGAAVAASNSSGTWTATHTLVAGAIDLTNRNVSVTATDNAGNTTTTADISNAKVDTIAPTVTDANIAINAGTGPGGAFVPGDTITATWNDTAGGDNNADPIDTVSVNFAQFGGGSVAASNSADTWTASYLLPGGATAGSNLNVSVTATDNAGNGTTRADTSNASMVAAAPTVTDANISISGASGTAGAFRIGDTVTATWDNSAGGDNNAGVTAVTVDFSAFGGGNMVSASNAAGSWTASFLLSAGAIDTSGANVSVTATSAGGSSTTADTTGATVDTIAPAVTDIQLSGTPAANEASVSFVVDLNDQFDNLDPTDFVLSATGTASGSIQPFAKTPGNQSTITVSGISGSGTLRLDLSPGNDIVDDAGNGPAAAFTGGAVHTVQRSAPSLSAAGSLTVLEDTASMPVAITVGDAETDPAALTLTATSSAQAVISDGALVSGLGGSGADRSLIVAPEPNANGSATLTLAVTDADMQVTSSTLAVTVTPVNDAPSASFGAEQRWPSGESGMKQVPGFASSLSSGPANESSQTLNGLADIVSDPQGVLSAIGLLGDGTLNYTLGGSDGAALVRFAVQDDGGTANGGSDTSSSVERRIVVGGGVDLTVTIERAGIVVSKGNRLTYRITVRNNGPDAASGILLRVPGADGLTGTSWTCTAPAPCTPASGSGLSMQPDGRSRAFVSTVFDLAEGEQALVDLVGDGNGLSVELVAESVLPTGQTPLLPFDDRHVLVEVTSGQGLSRSGFE